MIVSNSISTAESVHEYLIVEGRPDFHGNGLGWHLNGDTVNGGPSIVNNVFTMTDGTAGENRSAWYPYPLYIGAFEASFTYQDVGGGGADGASFCLQNDSRGTTTLGGGGGGLGYNGITPSVALLIDIYSGAAGGPYPNGGLFLGVNGVGASATSPYLSPAPVSVSGGNPINFDIRYTGGVLNVTLKDTVAGTTFNTAIPYDIPGQLQSDTALVGFTGSEGGTLSHQTVSNFVFTPLPELSAHLTASNAVVLSWTSVIGGYTLQSKANLGDTNPADWTTVAAPVTQANGLNQVIIPAPSGVNFYRLLLPANSE